MKTSAHKFTVVLLCLLCLLIGLLSFVACNQNDTFTLTLDAGNGSLNQTTVEVKKGASILTAVGDIVPKAEGLYFDEWLLDGQPLKAEDKMVKNVTLTATYKTLYRVEVYYQNADKTNYVQDDSKTAIGYGKVGESVSPSIAAVGGYVLNKELSADATKTLAAGENLLKYFYARADRTITYATLLEEGEVTFDVDTYNGAVETIADCTFERTGYTFMGWSDKIELAADEKYNVGNNISISENVKLYAQWGKAYDEAYKSGDSVVISELTDKNNNYIAQLILNDGTVTCGVIDKQTNFFTAGAKKGQVDDESGQFLYDATGLYLGYSLLGGATDEKYGTLKLDALTGNATYAISGKNYVGTYQELRLKNGTFSGEKYFESEDESFYFCFLDSEENDALDTAKYVGEFFRRGEEEGTYIVVDMSGGEFNTPFVYNIELDGYGGLSFPIPSFMNLANAYGSYSGYNEDTGEWTYVYEGQLFQDTVGEYPKTFTFKAGYLKSLAGSYIENADGTFDAEGEILNQIPIIVIYDENLAGTYEMTDGAKIDMDGYGNAVYTPANAEPIEGYVSFNGLASKKTETGDINNEEYWDSTDNLKALNFVYYDASDVEQNMVLLCRDYKKIERDSWLAGANIINVVEKHELVSVNAQKESGSYRKAHDEEDFIDFRLDGNGTAELSLFDGGNKISTWFATGSYVMTSENEGEFTLTDATQSLAYMGVAAGSFKFRLTANDGEATFIICDETLLGNFNMSGKTVVFDGYGSLTDSGVQYIFEKLGNNVLKAQDKDGNVAMYTVNYQNRTVVRSQSGALVGEYLTVVKDNALYIGPGKLVFDGNGRALFYEMANGVYIGEGLYAYDSATNRGEFITSGDIQFYVESFKFCIDKMTDSDGIVCDVYIKYVEANEITLTDEEGNELYFDGYGHVSYNNGAAASFELTEYEYLGIKLTIDGSEDIYSVNMDFGSFAKEDAFGLYVGVYYDEENGAFMINDDDAMYFYGIENGNMGEYGGYYYTMYECTGNKDEFIIYGYNDEDDLEDEFTVKLIELPAFDDFGDQYYVEVFLVYSEQLVGTYTDADGATIEVDGYGDVLYTDKNGNVFNVDFYFATITEDSMFIEINDERFAEPSKMLTVKYEKENNTFTTSNEAGAYVRYYNDDFYYPMLNIYGYDEEEGDYMFLLVMPQKTEAGTELIPYAIGTYVPVNAAENVYELTFTGKTDYFADVAHLFPKDKFKVKFAYIDNGKNAYSTYILIDETAEGEYTFEDTTYNLDGFGYVTTNDGQNGTAERVGDILIIEIDGKNSYFYIGGDNVLTVADYVVYIEFIK